MNNNNILDNLNKDNPFKTPDGYFENLSSTIEQTIETSENKKTAVYYLKTWGSIAAGFLLLVGLWQFILNNVLENNQDGNLANTEQTNAYEDYIVYSIDDESLLEYIAMNNETEEETNTEIDKEDLLNYLAEDVDYSIIYEQYEQ